MQKNTSPTREQREALKKAGLNPLTWAIKKDLPSSLIVLHRITGEFRVINK